MSDFLADGTPIQGGLNYVPRSQNPGKERQYIPYPVRGQVIAEYYVDDEGNRDGETMVYDVIVSHLGIALFRVPLLSDAGGIDNYSYSSAIEPSTSNVNFQPFTNTAIDTRVCNGDTVMIFFIEGDVRKPVIWGVFPHNVSGATPASATPPIPTHPDPRPGKSKGKVRKIRHQGMTVEIDNDGNITVDQTDTFNSLIKQVNQFKKIKFRLKAPLLSTNQEIVQEIDNSASGTVLFKFSAKNELGKKTELIIDGGNQKVELTSEQVTGDNTVVIDSAGVAVKSSADVSLEDSMTGKLNISGGKVALGAAAAELLDLVDQIIDVMDGTESDIQQITVTTAMGPSGTPLNFAAFIAHQSTLAQIKALLGQIKGSL